MWLLVDLANISTDSSLSWEPWTVRRGILFLCFSQHSFRSFLLIFCCKKYFTYSLPSFLPTYFYFSMATQKYLSLLLQFSRFFCFRKELKFGKVELTNSHDQEHVVGVNAYLAGVDEDSGRNGRSKLARRREAKIAQDHGIGNCFLQSWIDSEWFPGETYPPFDPVRGPKKDFSLLIDVLDSKSRHKMLALTWIKHCNGCPWKYHQALMLHSLVHHLKPAQCSLLSSPLHLLIES